MDTLKDWARYYYRKQITAAPLKESDRPFISFRSYDWDNDDHLACIFTGAFGVKALCMDFKGRDERYIFRVVTAALDLLELYNYSFVIREGDVISIMFKSFYGRADSPDIERFGRLSIIHKGRIGLPCYLNYRGSLEPVFYFVCIPRCGLMYVESALVVRCINELVQRFGITFDRGY